MAAQMSSTVTIEFDLSASSLRTAAGASGTESVWLSRLTGVPNCWLSSILKFMPSSARSGVFAFGSESRAMGRVLRSGAIVAVSEIHQTDTGPLTRPRCVRVEPGRRATRTVFSA